MLRSRNRGSMTRQQRLARGCWLRLVLWTVMAATLGIVLWVNGDQTPAAWLLFAALALGGVTTLTAVVSRRNRPDV